MHRLGGSMAGYHKAPGIQLVPRVFEYGIGFPVISASLTSKAPSRTMESAQIWFPEESSRISPSTTSSSSTWYSFPSRRTAALDADISDSLSKVRFARSSG